jgi:hypothetical protein
VRKWLAGVVVVVGCQPTVRSRAEVAYAEGNYLRAVELYDQILAEKPGDGDAHVERARARIAAFRAHVVAAHAARIRGNFEAALGELKRFFVLRRDWNITPPPQLEQAVATELTVVTNYVADSITRALATGPFAAEVVLTRHGGTLDLAGLGDRRAELAAPIRRAGLARCSELTATTSPAMPYRTWLVDRACAYWDGPRLVVPVLPHQLSTLEVTGGVERHRCQYRSERAEAAG